MRAWNSSPSAKRRLAMIIILRSNAGTSYFSPALRFRFPRKNANLLRSSELSSSRHHKNIAYRPASDKVTGFDSGAVKDPERLRTVLRSYSQHALVFLRAFLPRYMEQCRIDFASFRPLEEEGRDLPTKKRNDLLHVDSFPTRPTGGDLILRLFTNINVTKPRVWLTSDPFRDASPALRHRRRITANRARHRWFVRHTPDARDGPGSRASAPPTTASCSAFTTT